MPIVRGVCLWTFLRRWDSIQRGQWEQLQREAEQSWAGLGFLKKEYKSLTTAHQPLLCLAATPLLLSGITLPGSHWSYPLPFFLCLISTKYAPSWDLWIYCHSSWNVWPQVLDIDMSFKSGLRPSGCSTQFSLLFTTWLFLLPHGF